MADISQIKLPGENNGRSIKALKLPYGVCSTAAATAAKTVTIKVNHGTSGNNMPFVLEIGAIIAVKFTVTNTAANPTLNVNGSGAKAIYYRGAAISAGSLAINRTYIFIYNGTQWEFVGDIDTDSNTDVFVTQTATTTDGEYEVLFSGTADNTTRTESSRKGEGLKFNPSTNNLTVESSATIGSCKEIYNTTTESLDFVFV